jgi:hypothetical protein
MINGTEVDHHLIHVVASKSNSFRTVCPKNTREGIGMPGSILAASLMSAIYVRFWCFIGLLLSSNRKPYDPATTKIAVPIQVNMKTFCSNSYGMILDRIADHYELECTFTCIPKIVAENPRGIKKKAWV